MAARAVEAECSSTCDFADVFGSKAHDVETRLNLLCNQGLGGRGKDKLALRVPAPIVVHDNSSNERLSQT